MIEGASVKCKSADETLAVLEVTPLTTIAAGETRPVTGVVRGPYSDASRTLPAEFQLVPDEHNTLCTKIVDPCYSTGELQMEYELILWCQGDSASEYRSRFELQRKPR